MKIVEVTWIDSASLEGWDSLDRARELTPLRITTVGYLIHEDPEYYVITQSLNGQSKDVDYTIAIPAFAITTMRELG